MKKDDKVAICKKINDHVNAIADILAEYSTDKPFNKMILRNVKSINAIIRRVLFPCE